MLSAAAEIADGSARLDDVTAGRAVVNVCGPRSRELLARVADGDVDGDAFPFMSAQTLEIGYATVLALRVTYVGFRTVDPGEVHAQRLGGLTNRNYRLDHAGERFVVRIAGEGTGDYIDRRGEAHNAREAAAAGVGAEVVYFDPDDGLMLARYLDGTTTMSPERFASRPGAPARAAKALARMHRSGRRFEFRFELFAMIDEYLSVLSRAGDVSFPDGYHDVLGESRAVREALDARAGELAPCHCDPLCENFLDDGERMWIVDWEYSGMNDPLWDLGDVSVEGGFDAAQDLEMMTAYCAGEPPPAVFGRMVVYKAMADLLWTLWGLIQHVNDNPAEDFWAYATGRFDRCRTLMGSAEFSRHLRSSAR